MLFTQVTAPALNHSLVIVVNKSNTINSLTLADLKRIFTKKNRIWPNKESIVPVDWEATTEARKQFSKKVHGKTVLEMREFWVLQSMTAGLTPPSTQKSAKAILMFVSNVPGAISYLPADECDDTVKMIRVPGVE